MKNYLIFIIISVIAFNASITYSSQIEINSTSVKVVLKNDDSRSLTRADSLIFLSNYYKQIPSSYKYISLQFKGVETNSKLYIALQKLVYLNLIDNNGAKVHWDKDVSAYIFYRLSEKILWEKLISDKEIPLLKDRLGNIDDLRRVIKYMKALSEKIEIKEFEAKWVSDELKIKQKIFVDTYNTLLKSHYDKDNLSEIKIWNSAIEWLTAWTEDVYTAYFPPVKNKNFYESLNWEYEWIWSYVDMEKPGEVKILTPITGSPSEKAWLKWWDVILKVDQKEINQSNSLLEVISWIKWKAWTKVVLTILRKWRTFDVTVIRWKIVIKDVGYKLIDRKHYYISIRSFGDNVSEHFKAALEDLKTKRWVKTVIIDLRNNGWGYLDEVSDMLWYFIEKWETTAVVEYLKWDKEYKSVWYELIDFSDYKLILLQNSWTASASEIMIWTLKDYYPDSIIIWEKSYWKGSVQTIKAYTDGSSLKYTIAKWFTWKTKTWIDWIWISPDIEIELDMDNLEKDEILQKALKLR